MNRYYVNDTEQENGDHEVHKDNCFYLLLIENKTDLGYHYNFDTAADNAKNIYIQTNGCFYCCNPHHNS